MIRISQIVIGAGLLVALLLTSANAADMTELQSRRQRAAAAFSDVILLVHARSVPDEETDGFRQDPAFYYFTGLENTAGAILAIDGRSRESWLFLPTHALYWKILPPEGSADSAAVRAAGIEHVADWSELEEFLTTASASRPLVHYIGDEDAQGELSPKHHRTAGVGAGRWYIEPDGDAFVGGHDREAMAGFSSHRGQPGIGFTRCWTCRANPSWRSSAQLPRRRCLQ